MKKHGRLYWHRRAFLNPISVEEVSSFFASYRLLCLLAMAAIFGMITGIICICSFGTTWVVPLGSMLDYHFSGGTEQPLSVFLASLASSFWLIVLCFLCGLSVWGFFVAPLIPFVKGIGLGLVTGYLYAVHGWSGFLACLLTVFPGALIFFFALLFAVNHSVHFSRSLFKKLSSGQPVSFSEQVKKYVFSYCKLFILVLASAGADFIGASCFNGLFSF